MSSTAQTHWYGVRCVFRHSLKSEEAGSSLSSYEERITIWQAPSFDEAIAKAEVEAEQYATDFTCENTGISQAYLMDASPEEGSEVFSLMRDSSLSAAVYIDWFFDDGAERQV